MSRALRRVAGLGVAVLVAACAGDGGAGSPRRLQAAPGRAVQASLAAGEVHEIAVALGEGDYLGARIEQRGLDLLVEVGSPRVSSALTVDAPLGGEGAERVCFVAGTAGLHRLRIRPLDGSTAGVYVLTLEAPRPATEDDRRCQQAAQLFAAVERWRAAGGAAAPQLAGYARARDLWRRSGHFFQAAIAEREAALLRGELGDPAGQEEQLRNALRWMRRAGDRRQQVILLNLLGTCLRRLGRTDEAASAYGTALHLARRHGDRRGEATALNNLALVERARGEVHRALQRYEEALVLWKLAGEQGKAATTLLNAAVAYTVLGRFEDAFDTLEEAEALARARDDRHLQAALWNTRGWALYQSGLRDGRRDLVEAAIAEYQRAAELGRLLDDLDIQGAAHDRRGTALFELGRLPHAARAYRRALEVFAATGDRQASAHSRANLGRLLAASGRTAEARRELEAARPVFQQLDDPDGLARVLAGLAELDRRQGDLAAARRHLEQALEQVSDQRLDARRQGARESPHRLDVDLVERYLDLLFELAEQDPAGGHAARAFEVSDLARAHNLYQMLLDSDIPLRRSIPEELKQRERYLQAQLNRLGEDRRTASADDPRERDRQRELRRLLRRYAALEAEIRRADPRFAALRDPTPLAVEEVRRLLDPGTVVLSYVLAEERSFLIVVGADFLHVHQLPGRQRIEELAAAAYAGLRYSRHRRTRRQTAIVTAALSDVLLGPARADLDAERLVVLGEEILHLIPFAALPQPGAPAAGGEPRLLIEDHEVVHLPSASVLAVLRRREADRSPPPGVLAVLADPVFSPLDGRVASAVAARPPDPSEDGAPPFGRLRHSRREGRAIAALAPAGDRLLLLDAAAAKPRVLGGELAKYRILHFATHAVIDEHPELSGIVLSTVDAEGRRRDGHLRLHEIFALDLPADLVVLSGCRTALGARIRGDGVLGLTRGFFHAGASRVLVSLWDVPDAATAELMSELYRGLLLDGLSPAAALRRAQLHVRRQERWNRPYFWAGFVLQGDWRTPAPLPPTNPSRR